MFNPGYQNVNIPHQHSKLLFHLGTLIISKLCNIVLGHTHTHRSPWGTPLLSCYLTWLDDSKRQHQRERVIPINQQILGGGESGMQYLKRFTIVLHVFVVPKPTGGTFCCQACGVTIEG
jgi:hypothetical protein